MRTENRVNLFGSQIREKIFSLLFLNPTKEYYLREIAKNIDCSAGAVQRELSNLMKLGILTREDKGNASYYSTNKKHLIYKELKSIAEKQGEWLRDLNKTIKSFGTNITIAFIYGSYVKGNETPESDIDLFILGDLSSMQLATQLKPTEEKIGREINPYLITKEEFITNFKAKNHFLCSLIKEKKLFIVGNNDEIQELTK